VPDRPGQGRDAARDELEYHDRIYLEKLRLAAEVILRHGEDPGMITDILETELHLLRERIERALLMVSGAAGSGPGATGR
jgi:hypothetical protein